MNKERYLSIKDELSEKGVLLIAVSKTKPQEDILDLYELGQRNFGENYVQELVDKYEALPKDINWHMIGHLQSNKVKYIAPFISLIHSVDRLSLLKEINKRAKQNNRIINVLLQVHIAKEDTKFGFNEQEILDFVESEIFKDYSNVSIIGVMGMATFTENLKVVQEEFSMLTSIFKRLKDTAFSNNEKFNEVSMGMSGDYQLAIEEGSTMVRIGSLIFGAREYKNT